MKALNKRKTRYSFVRVSVGLVLCCACLVLLDEVSLAQGVMGMEDIPSSSIDDHQSSSNDDRLTDFISGPVESISDFIIKVRGVEYTFSMNMKCMDMNERPVDIESVHEGDSVKIIFDARNNEALSLTLEQSGTANSKPSIPSREEETQGKRKIIFEDGIYKY
jgi:hypothetical protein